MSEPTGAQITAALRAYDTANGSWKLSPVAWQKSDAWMLRHYLPLDVLVSCTANEVKNDEIVEIIYGKDDAEYARVWHVMRDFLRAISAPAPAPFNVVELRMIYDILGEKITDAGRQISHLRSGKYYRDVFSDIAALEASILHCTTTRDKIGKEIEHQKAQESEKKSLKKCKKRRIFLKKVDRKEKCSQ